MSLSMRIAAHLPYLRRFSRALTGSQTVGDAYVAGVLEALIADISLFPAHADDRINTFQLYCRIFPTLSITDTAASSPFGWEQKASVNLARMAPETRKAFLLVSVEGFSPAEAALILDESVEAVDAQLAAAARSIKEQVATEVMIIEDEPLIALDLEDLVRGLGHTVTGIARTHAEAVDLFARTQPKLVLADIQLADGSSGIDAVNDILKSATIPVIFITAFPERLLTGEKPEPAFLVTKPFNPDMVRALISQALFFNETASSAQG
ncbi:DNA-directed RNA polymerase specialized sigma subunit, sigma24 family [Rhizobium sp. RU20A]|uniref:response regulator n=1 Tax=Rhizobium sp. RU20A TaxID=1907412 RepID=UPI000956B16A|nr:response regulator [Rhizobium sp. RU20A]SIQ52814.1 DNA-directed RNA polymerase specialized sigma subunit, sigma24 family [Rhizobium sp. RU20A]